MQNSFTCGYNRKIREIESEALLNAFFKRFFPPLPHSSKVTKCYIFLLFIFNFYIFRLQNSFTCGYNRKIREIESEALRNVYKYFPQKEVRLLGDFGDFVARIFYNADEEKGMLKTAYKKKQNNINLKHHGARIVCNEEKSLLKKKQK